MTPIESKKFTYSMVNNIENYSAYNNPLTSISLLAAIYEMLETEIKINSNIGLNEISTLTIHSHNKDRHK